MKAITKNAEVVDRYIEIVLETGDVVGPFALPKRAEVLAPSYSGLCYRMRIEGRGYSGGHNTADRLGWETSKPQPPCQAIAWWDETREGTWTGYYPAIGVILPCSPAIIAETFCNDAERAASWHVSRLAPLTTRLGAMLTNGVRLSVSQWERLMSFSIIGEGEGWEGVLQEWKETLGGIMPIRKTVGIA